MLQVHPVPSCLQVAVPLAQSPCACNLSLQVPVSPGVQGHVSLFNPLQLASSPTTEQL